MKVHNMGTNGPTNGPINKNYENVYCSCCMIVTPCITKRLIDSWQWTCSICGSIADVEYDILDDDWDDDLDDDNG